jgi:small subunit ribosomal protein S3Ae
MAKRDASQLKWKKKKWIEISAPGIFSGASLGQALAEDPKSLIGRVIQANMMNVVRNPKMQSITMRFRITDVKDNHGVTEPISYVMSPAAVKRLVRSRRDRIDDSFVIVTKDGKKVRIKPLLVTHFNNAASKLTGIRLRAREMLSAICAEKTFEEFISNVVNFSIQKTIKKAVSTIVPIRIVEMRSFELVDGKKAKNIVEVKEKPVEEASEESDEESTEEVTEEPKEDAPVEEVAKPEEKAEEPKAEEVASEEVSEEKVEEPAEEAPVEEAAPAEEEVPAEDSVEKKE